MNDIFKTVNPGMFRTRDEFLRYLAEQKAPLVIKLTNDYAFQKVFKNKIVAKGFLMTLLHLTEETIADIEIIDPFKEGEYEEEKEGILDIKIHMADGKKFNLEMQNQRQFDWKERTIFYNCRMFLDGFLAGMQYHELEPCIHVGILNFNLFKDSGFHQCIKLMNEKTHEVYSDKLQFHVIQLKQLDKEPLEEEKELHRWARLIAAENWEVVDMAAKGNLYMETAREEMLKISMTPAERYLYLRRQMAKSDEASNLWGARKEGENRVNKLNLILLKENRYADLKQAAEDKDFQEKLFQQYNL